MSIILTYQLLPHRIKALTHDNQDGSYTIIINNSISIELQRIAILHELLHIERDDFYTHYNANLIEKLAHSHNKQNVNLSKLQFYCV